MESLFDSNNYAVIAIIFRHPLLSNFCHSDFWENKYRYNTLSITLSVDLCVRRGTPLPDVTFWHPPIFGLVTVTERFYRDPLTVVCVLIGTANVVLLFCHLPDQEEATNDQYQHGGKTSQGDHSHLQAPDNSVSVLNLDKVLDHSLMVLFALHCLHRFTGVKASIRIGGSDDKTLADQSVLRTRIEDARREPPADWKVGLRGTWQKLRSPSGKVYDGGFH